MEKATFRLPEWELDRLREESRIRGKSLNTIAVEVIAIGLGHASGSSDLVRELGPMVARPPTGPFRPLGGSTIGVPLEEALNWTREDR